MSDIFVEIAAAAQRAKLPILVIGGHAVNAYGYVRTTLDADFLVCSEDFAAWRRIFQSLGYLWHGQTEAFAKLLPPKTEPPSLPVDVMLVSRDTFSKLEQNQRELKFGATRLKVPQPLFLIALKLHAMRNESRRRLGKDLTDVLQIIRLCEIDPASADFRQILDRYADAPTRSLLTAALENA